MECVREEKFQGFFVEDTFFGPFLVKDEIRFTPGSKYLPWGAYMDATFWSYFGCEVPGKGKPPL